MSGSSPAKKKARTSASSDSMEVVEEGATKVPEPTIADLCGTGITMDNIMAYCDARSLLRLTCYTSKSLGEFVSLKHVVFSAVSSGGGARESLDRVVKLVKKKTIHTPSKMRLLRILNGCRCERGDQCVQYAYAKTLAAESKTKEAKAAAATKDGKDFEAKIFAAGARKAKETAEKFPKGVKFIRKDFGLFVCNDCTEAWRTELLPKNSAIQHGTCKLSRCLYGWFLKNNRLAVRDQNTSFSPIVWKDPFVDAAGEKAGPVLTHKDCADANCSEEALNKRLEDIDKDDTEARKDTITYWKEAMEMIEKRKQAKVSQTEEKRLQRYNKRLEQYQDKVFKVLQERFEGTAWKDIALASDPHPDGKKYLTSEPVVTFKCPIVQTILEEVLIVPNKANKTNMTGKANEIIAAFNLIWSAGFHDLSFLNPAADGGDRLCIDLRDYYKSRVTPATLLHHGRMHPDVLGLIRSGRCVEALYRRFQNSCGYRASSSSKNGKGEDDPKPAWFDSDWPRVDENTIDDFFTHTASRNPSLGGVVPEEAVSEIAAGAGLSDYGTDGCYSDTKDADKGFEDLWKEQHKNCLKNFDNMLSVARDYCADVMNGSYGEQPGESEALRARRKEILCSAVKCYYYLNGKYSFKDLRETQMWQLEYHLNEDIDG